MEKGIFIDNVTFRFSADQKPFFDMVSLHVPAGRLHFIQGKNGTGKSTLFRILQGQLMPGEILLGSYALDAEKVMLHNGVPKTLTSKVKTVVQDTSRLLADEFTVERNLQCAQLPRYPGLRALPVVDKLPPLLSRCGIEKTALVERLSGGQRQILAISMVLQKPTSVLLLDEPTAALDQENATMVMDFIRELAVSLNLTVLIISHDKELVNAYSAGSYSELYKKEDLSRAVRTIETE